MPIYEYRCSACGHELEVLQKMSDKTLTDCPSCGKATLSKLVSAAGFQLKGSGWYVTDFRDNNKPAATGDKGGDQSGSNAASKSGESSDSAGKGKKQDTASTTSAKSDKAGD